MKPRWLDKAWKEDMQGTWINSFPLLKTIIVTSVLDTYTVSALRESVEF